MSIARRQVIGRRAVTCAFDAVIPGQLQTALYVAQRESRFDPFAQNPVSLCSGLFQFQLSTWKGRVFAFTRQREFPRIWPNVSPFNARANALVAARIVKMMGWGPWALPSGKKEAT
jgi:hypothetical protein